MRSVATRGPVTILVAILIVCIAPDLAPEICYRVLQAVELVAEHIELVPAERHVAAAGSPILPILGRPHDGSCLVAVDILPLVGRMV